MDTPTLYPHQQRAADFLAARPRAGLFDDMGLGKTAAAITASRQVASRRTLVLAPTVVTRNWIKELRTWHPGARAQLISKGTQPIDIDAQYVVVSHGLLIRPTVLAALLQQKWDVVIADEAHAFKNPKARRARVFYTRLALPAVAKHVWVLTGTPMPNAPTELWTMLASMAPERIRDERGRAMNWYAFRDRFCQLAPSSFTPDKVRVVGAKNIDELRERMRGFSLRRRKDQVLDLPPIRWCTTSLTVDKLPKELVELEARLPKNPADAVRALREEAEFSTWRRLCGLAKAEAAADLLADELENGAYRKVVVFAHHLEVLDVLQARLRDFGAVRISGDVPADARQRAVELFQSDSETRVVLANIVAGGVGITLTAAAEVVFVEQSFVPGDMRQAADRCHRIGQTHSVTVRCLSLAGSVDELAAEILARKAQMIREIVEGGR